MSSWMISHEHATVLVAAAYRHGATNTTAGPRVRFYADNPKTRHEYAPTVEDASRLGRLLLAENASGQAEAYPEASKEDGLDEYAASYVFPPTAFSRASHHPNTGPVSALKLLQSYAYQACESPTWETSTARAFTLTLTDDLIHALPGYDDAPWSI